MLTDTCLSSWRVFPSSSRQALFEGEATQVNISSTSGEMGILASHVPSIEQLAPGLLEVIEASGTKKWFGGCLAEGTGRDRQQCRTTRKTPR